MSDVAPGWYSDPTNPLQERLWDGSEWLDNVRPRPPVSISPESMQAPTLASAQRPVLDLASKSSQTRRISGVTQTLIALAVIGTLAAIAVPAFSAVTDKSSTTTDNSSTTTDNSSTTTDNSSTTTDNSSTTTDNSSDQGVYAIGDVGPGGGRVYITPSTRGNTTGLYFEAAPAESQDYWCNNRSTWLGASGTAIGQGQSNTAAADATCTSGAIQIASDYANNGFSDWFLPSLDELNELYVNRAYVGGFSSGYYWSSSEYSGYSAWSPNFYDGYQSFYSKNYASYVRPVRAFN